MLRIVLSALLMTALCSGATYFPLQNSTITITEQEEFYLLDCIYSSHEDYCWKAEDKWQLEYYPISSLKLLSQGTSTTPQEELLQKFTFKARKKGIFEILFKRYTERIIVTVIVN